MNPNLINKALRRLAALAILAASIATGTLAQTTEPSREPILRIEAGMHTSIIQSISVDASKRYLVTSADDQTLRLWDLREGRQLRVIRPPLGERGTGMLFSGAISPDGRTIAAMGSWQPVEEILRGKGSFSIYLFERDSGRLIHRIDGLPIWGRLYYSNDSHYLVTLLSTNWGVRVYDMTTYALTSDAKDAVRRSGLFPADIHKDRLVTASEDDGLLRLYELRGGALKLLLSRKPSGGSRPSSVEFSPDGSRIAVGFLESTKVEVISASELSPMYSPNTSSVTNGDLSSVAWSGDGQTLYAGGLYQSNGNACILAWQDQGQGGSQEFCPVKARLVSSILPWTGSSALYNVGATVSAIEGLRSRAVLDFVPTFPFDRSRLFVSADSSIVQFSPRDSDQVAYFSLTNRELAPGAAAGTVFPTHQITTERAVSSDPLYGTYQVRPQTANDSNNRKELLVGQRNSVRLYDENGGFRWATTMANAVNGVKIAEDGRFALVTQGDGTIHWLRMTDGKELLAFFPHKDLKRWVLWTPSGYYDASPGAEDFVGWHVNNGKDQAADFFPVGQFRSTYYRPDVISKILETGDEARALQLANEERGRKSQSTSVSQMLPPVVEIASPSDNSEVSSSEVTIRYSLRTPSGEPVTNVRALVDGRPITGSRQLTREETSASGVRELKVPVPERDSEVSIIAENRFAASVPATIRLKWRGKTATPATEAFVIQPKLYVLAIGVSQYQNPSYSLKFAAKDAQDFADAAAAQKALLYRDVVTKVLVNEHATKDEILDGLDWIRKETTSKDVAMVFFAGHGLNDQNGVYYFLPYNTDLEKLLRTGVPFTDIKSTVQSLAGKTLFFIDTCHSGNVLGGRRGLADDLNGIINELSSAESGAVVFAASTGNQYSLEDAKWNNGAFTKALVEGITGRADYSGKGRITINMLDLYISERVKELTGGKQTPTTAKPNTIQDFPIAVKH